MAEIWIMRQRNSIVVFIGDDGVRDELQEMLALRGWNVLPASTLNEATLQFRLAGEELAVVITDSVSRRDEGPRYDMEGINFLRQRELDRFIANIPFILLMFRGNRAIQEWVDDQGGWSVRVPKTKLSVVADLAETLEQTHALPKKPVPSGGSEL